MGYAGAPMLIVFGVLGVLVLVLRWAFSNRRDSLLSRPPKSGPAHEYGLMTPLVAPRDAAEGAEICGLLRREAIRAKLVNTQDGLRVMVWSEDLQRARDVLLG